VVTHSQVTFPSPHYPPKLAAILDLQPAVDADPVVQDDESVVEAVEDGVSAADVLGAVAAAAVVVGLA